MEDLKIFRFFLGEFSEREIVIGVFVTKDQHTHIHLI